MSEPTAASDRPVPSSSSAATTSHNPSLTLAFRRRNSASEEPTTAVSPPLPGPTDEMPTPTATSATSTAANAPTSPTAPLDDDEGNDYECNVCLEVASSPVVTLCGHLFCWPCLHYWMQTRSAFAKACPVCKAKVEQDKIIPIYGRGREAEDPRLKVIPKRPTAAAPPQVTRYGGGWQGFGGGGPTGNGVTVGLGIFPSLFGVHFSVGTQMGGVAGQRPAPDAFQPGSFVSRLFMMIGILSMLAIILS